MSELVQTPELGAPRPRSFTLAMELLLDIGGTYPVRGGGGPATNVLAMVHIVAANVPAFGSPACAGRQLPVNRNQALYSVLGSSFGGGGSPTAFSLPDLRGRIAIGGQPGLIAGRTLAMTYLIAVAEPNGPPATAPMLGAIGLFAGNYAPPGWAIADGSSIPLRENIPLFQAIGTAYGGDGVSFFKLPNLVGRAAVGIGQGMQAPPIALGQQIDPSANMGVAGLGLNYIVNVNGNYPSQTGNGGFPNQAAVLGEVVAYAAASVPPGWAAADGSLLNTAQYPALFQMIGTTYGGDGETSFALPDLRGLMIVGAS